MLRAYIGLYLGFVGLWCSAMDTTLGLRKRSSHNLFNQKEQKVLAVFSGSDCTACKKNIIPLVDDILSTPEASYHVQCIRPEDVPATSGYRYTAPMHKLYAEEICPICCQECLNCQEPQVLYIGSCGHAHHAACILPVTRCPQCRTPLQQELRVEQEEDAGCSYYFFSYFIEFGQWMINTQMTWTDKLFTLQHATIKFAESAHPDI